jgi:carboxylate-amine ligase
MEIAFNRSPRASVGIEWELSLVDLGSLELVPVAGELLELVDGGPDRPVRKEYLKCMVEIVSGAHLTVAAAMSDIATQFESLQRAAETLGVGVIGSGSHPFSRPDAQAIFSTPRYDAVAERNQWWGRQMAICGAHVHVGVADRSLALPLTWAYARFYPYLLALSASSPFWDGADTGYASQRTMMFQQLPTNGLPHRFDAWGDFERHLDDLTACGMIAEASELRWDVRPAPQFGTVENRIPDAPPTMRELACQAALTQCLGEYVVQSLEAGDTPDHLPRWLVRENKWRACRYGLDATVITPDPAERLLPLREGLADLVNRLLPIAEGLECVDELSLAFDILERGASYERQRLVAAHALGDAPRAVAESLLDETANDAPAW